MMKELPLILVVDDDPYALKLIQAYLARHPYDVVCAESAASAWNHIAQRTPDVVILDVMMPDVDGFDLCAQLREHTEMRHVPIVMVTALDSRECVVEGLRAGADEFLVKPLHGAELCARLRNLVKVKAYHDLLAQQRASAEAQVNSMREMLLRADKLAQLGTFTASVGHEINNVASVLEALVTIIDLEWTEDGQVNPDNIDGLRHIQEHIANHGQTLLNMARSNVELRREPVMLETLLNTVFDMLAVSGRSRLLTHQNYEVVDGACVFGVRTHLEQVMLNLLINAIDAMEEQDEQRIEVHVKHCDDGHGLCMSVQDNGPGMSEEVLERLFDPFFTTKPHGRGTGLGMAVVRQLVHDHEGEIRVESAPGVGTTIHVMLPVMLPDA